MTDTAPLIIQPRGVDQTVPEPPRPVEVYLPPTGYTRDQLVASFLASPRFSRNTREAYRGDLRLYFAWCDEQGLDPLTLGLPEVQVYGRWLMETPSPRTGRIRVNKTVDRMIDAVSSWYTYVGRVGAMHYHPAANAERPVYDRQATNTRTISVPQARAMVGLAGTHAPRTWHPLCAQLTMHLLIDLGNRVSEVCNIDLDHLSTRTDHTGATWRVAELHMKGGKVAVRPIPVQLCPLLDAWRIHRVADPDEQALLVDRNGTRLTRYQVEHLITVLAVAAGIPDPEKVTPHSCRHAFNTIAKEHGSDLEKRQRALRHASPATTQLYDHVAEDLAADPAHAVAAAMFAPTDTERR